MDRGPAIIAIVDDDDAVRDSLSLLLGAHGMTVRAYASPGQFLSDAASRADCLIFDLHMPEMTGIELAERLRGRGISTPIVIVTGRNDPRLAPRMQRAGVSAVLSKPVDEEKLLACIRDAGQSN